MHDSIDFCPTIFYSRSSLTLNILWTSEIFSFIDEIISMNPHHHWNRFQREWVRESKILIGHKTRQKKNSNPFDESCGKNLGFLLLIKKNQNAVDTKRWRKFFLRHLLPRIFLIVISRVIIFYIIRCFNW